LIGYGHQVKQPVRGSITFIEAEQLFVVDFIEASKQVARLVSVPLTPGQYGALVSLVYNVGHIKFRDSSLRKVINQGKFSHVEREWVKWVYVGKVKTKGLVNRRKEELRLWRGEYPDTESTK
jgi:lysozyme